MRGSEATGWAVTWVVDVTIGARVVVVEGASEATDVVVSTMADVVVVCAAVVVVSAAVVVVSAAVVVVSGTVVVVSGTVVVVSGTATSNCAVTDSAEGTPPVTRVWAPCGSGEAGIPRKTTAGTGALAVATTVTVPAASGTVTVATPSGPVVAANVRSVPLTSTEIVWSDTGVAPETSVAVSTPSSPSVNASCHWPEYTTAS